MLKESLLQQKESFISVKSTSSKKNQLLEEYHTKKKNYIEKYGYVDKDPIDEGNCFSNFFMYWAYRILKLSNLVNIDTPYLGKFSKEHSSPTYFKNLMEF